MIKINNKLDQRNVISPTPFSPKTTNNYSRLIRSNSEQKLFSTTQPKNENTFPYFKPLNHQFVNPTELLSIDSKTGNTLLHIAAIEKDVQFLMYLLNYENNFGKPLFHNINILNHNHLTPLDEALKNFSFPCAQLLIRHIKMKHIILNKKGIEIPLVFAVITKLNSFFKSEKYKPNNSCPEIITFATRLLNETFSIDEINYSLYADYPLLTYAILFYDLEIIQLLLNLPDINLNVLFKNQISLIFIAVEQQNEQVLNLLLASPKINPNIMSHFQWAPLHLAAELTAKSEINNNKIEEKNKSLRILERLLLYPQINILEQIKETKISIMDFIDDCPIYSRFMESFFKNNFMILGSQLPSLIGTSYEILNNFESLNEINCHTLSVKNILKSNRFISSELINFLIHLNIECIEVRYASRILNLAHDFSFTDSFSFLTGETELIILARFSSTDKNTICFDLYQFNHLYDYIKSEPLLCPVTEKPLSTKIEYNGVKTEFTYLIGSHYF